MPEYHRRAGWRSRKRFGEFVDTRSTGAAIWEMLHPEQVQREYIAVGKTPPDYGDIYSNALNDAITAARESGQNVASAVTTVASEAARMGQLALIALIIGGVIFLSGRKRK